MLWINGWSSGSHQIKSNHHPTKKDVLQKTFVQIILAAKWFERHSRMSPNLQRRPLPLLFYLYSYSMVYTRYRLLPLWIPTYWSNLTSIPAWCQLHGPHYPCSQNLEDCLFIKIPTPQDLVDCLLKTITSPRARSCGLSLYNNHPLSPRKIL